VSRRSRRWLFFGSGLVLVAGIVAVLVVFVGNTGTKESAPFENRPVQVPQKPKQVPLPAEARKVAGRFILTAVQREHLDEAWKLAGPSLRNDITYKQWLSGNIPVVPFGAKIDVAPMKVDLSTKDHAYLEVALVPVKGSKVETEIFDLELRLINNKWVVESWTPRARPTIPTNPGN
jgi:hypothetical protein